MTTIRRVLTIAVFAAAAPALLAGQQRGAGPGGRGGQAPRSPKDAAPIDLTGYWVSIVTEDWRWRMVTPLKGDSASVPVNAEGKKIVNDWDPARDEAAGLQCKSYGAAAIMRVPGRVHITWQDDSTLQIDTDAGMQTRVLHFGGNAPQGAPASWQGYSAAAWEGAPAIPGGGAPLGLAGRVGVRSRSLEVTTTNLSAGFLRKNGVPYSANTVVKEYFDRFTEPNGDERFTVMTVVTDPQYLAVPFVTTSDFKKESDGSKWDPSPCTAR